MKKMRIIKSVGQKKKKTSAKKFSLRAEHNVCADKLCAAYRKDGFTQLIKQKKKQ